MPTSQDKRNFIGGLDRDSDLRLVRNGDYTYALNLRNMSSEGQGVGALESVKGNKLVYKDGTGSLGTDVKFTYHKIQPDVQISYIFFNPLPTSTGSLNYLVNISFAQEDEDVGDFSNSYSLSITNSDTSGPLNNNDIKGNSTTGFTKFVDDHATDISNNYSFTLSLVSGIPGDAYYDPEYAEYSGLTNYALKLIGSTNQVSLSFAIDGSQSNVGESEWSSTSMSAVLNETGGNEMADASISGQTLQTADVDGEVQVIDYKCIGSYEDTRNDKMYYFVASEPGTYFHHILEYDLIKHSKGGDDIISVVFRDTGNKDSRVFDWNFDFLITNIDRIGDVLYFTQEFYGEPCSINIRRSKNSMALVDSVGAYQIQTVTNSTGYTLKDYYPYDLYNPLFPTGRKRGYVEVIKVGPQDEPTYIYYTDESYKKNNLFGHMFQFKYRYHYYDQEVSAWSPISKVVASLPLRNNNNFSADDSTVQTQDNQISVKVKNGSGIVSHIEVAARKCISVGVGFSKGNAGDFMSIAKIENSYHAWLQDENSTQTVDFYNDKLYIYIDRVEGNKLFDSVPRTAKTQTVLGNNRLAYANYKLGFDLPKVKVHLQPFYHSTSGGSARKRYPFLTNHRTSYSSAKSMSVTYYNSSSGGYAGDEVTPIGSNGTRRPYSTAGARTQWWDWDNFIEDDENVWLQAAQDAGYVSPNGYTGANDGLPLSEFEEIQVVRGYNPSLQYLDTLTNELYAEDGGIVYPEVMFSDPGSRHWTYSATSEGSDIPDISPSDVDGVSTDAELAQYLEDNNHMVLTPSPFVLPPDKIFEEKVGFLDGENPLGSGNWCGGNEADGVAVSAGGGGLYPRLRFSIDKDDLDFSLGATGNLYISIKFHVRQELCLDANEYNFEAQDSQLFELSINKVVQFDDSITDTEEQFRVFLASFLKHGGNGTLGGTFIGEGEVTMNNTDIDNSVTLDSDGNEIPAEDADTRFIVYHTEADVDSRSATENEDGIMVADDGVALYKTPVFINGRMYIEFILPQQVKFDNTTIEGSGGETPRHRYVVSGGDFSTSSGDWNSGESYSIKSPGYSLVYNRNGNDAYFEYTPDPEGGTSSTFKSGAFHSFGLVYYDEKGKASTVALDSGEKHPFLTEERTTYLRTDEDWPNGVPVAFTGTAEDGNLTDLNQLETFQAGTDNVMRNPALSRLQAGTSTKTYVRFPTERTYDSGSGGGGKGHTTIEWSIFHEAPDWAKYYRWAYSKNTTVDDFVQFIAHGSFVNAENNDDKRIFLELKGLKGTDESYRDNKGAIIDYIGGRGRTEEDGEGIVQGENKDRIRFLRKKNGDSLDDYIDVKISGYDYFSQTDSSSPLAKLNDDGTVDEDDTPKSGFFVYFNEIDKSGWRWTDVKSSSDNDNYRNCFFEIYRPKADPEEDSRIFYEFGRRWSIVDGKHMGPDGENGNGNFYDDLGNKYFNNPAKGVFENMGDVYIKRRTMPTGAESDPMERLVEDYNLNDFYPTNHHSLGRINLYSAFSKETQRENNITWSEKYQPETNYNGLSTFNPAYINSKALSKVDGSIQKIYNRDTNVLVIHEDKTYQVSVDKDIVVNASGSSQMGLSRNVLGNPVPYWGHFGISKNPESFVAHGNVCYWVDIKRGAVLRLSRDGFTVLSDIKMVDYFRDKSNAYDKYDPEHGVYDDNNPFEEGHSLFRIISGYDPKHHEFVITFPQITHNEATAALYDNWENGSNNWDGETSVPGLGTYTNVTSETVAFSEKLNRWTTFYTFVPEMYGKMNSNFFSFNHSQGTLTDLTEGPILTTDGSTQGGHLWWHNSSSFYHKFYNQSNSTLSRFRLKVPFNQAPSTIKTYKALSIEGSSCGGYLTTDIVTTDVVLSSSAWDERENIQYASIPYVADTYTGGDGDELTGLANCAMVAVSAAGNYIQQTGTTNSYGIAVNDSAATFDASETIGGADAETNVSIDAIKIKSTPIDSATAPNIFDNSKVSVGDNIYALISGTTELLGTVASIQSPTELTLTPSGSDQTFESEFVFSRSSSNSTGIVDGTRVKGSYLELYLSESGTSKKEIFSINAIAQRSDLSDR